MSDEKKKYLAIHGHFYQPPRENPWLESIEMQDSAAPFHDWNERITCECYTPNSVSKIVDYKNHILDIVNNYSFISYNFGPTLLSWLEKYSPKTYERIIESDVKSIQENNGHGNAMAQVYNHIIMPLANKRDKYTQTIWGIRDFNYRFGRMPEGIWLAETAVDEETLEVLIDCGIKFTVLSPYQAQKCRKIGDTSCWYDVSWGNIDPARPYRYYLKSNPDKYIDLFFYDGAISKSVAFDELLKDGNKFISRLKEGLSDSRSYNQIVNIATDGESYGHHTKFGDMALAYILRLKAIDEGFIVTNYANYLASEPVEYEVEIKPVSSWSCAHGVGRWCEDCGCSTGGAQGWNQKWRRPLREAFDYLRDEMAKICEVEANKYFKDFWDARNNYISVVLDRNDSSIRDFLENNMIEGLDYVDKVNAMKLMEIQRQAMLMYTSCGWFFSEISGIETTQIMKYAARAMQLISEFTSKDLEGNFLKILEKAQSNIADFGTGREVYERFVKPSIVSTKQIASLWALSSLYNEHDNLTSLYCYEITKNAYKRVKKGNINLVIGRISLKSKITLENSDLILALIQYPDGDFHCAIREYSDSQDFSKIQKDLLKAFEEETLTEIIRLLDEHFGKEYYTLKDIFIEERREILKKLLNTQLRKFSDDYREVYNEGKASILQLKKLGLSVPEEFKLAAQYTLSHDFNEIFRNVPNIFDENILQSACEINNESKLFELRLDKSETSKIFSEEIADRINDFVKNYEKHRLDKALEIFQYIDMLEIEVDISEAQNVYYNRIYSKFPQIISKITDRSESDSNRELLLLVLKLGDYLNINTEFYKSAVIKATVIK